MDDNRFDSLTRSLTPLASRRTLVGGLLGTAAGWLGMLDAEARKNRKPKKRKRPKPAKPNQYGCLEVNDPCRRHLQCCSGICTGKPGKKRCRAHGAGTCVQGGVGLCTVPVAVQAACDGSTKCACLETTAGSNFCAAIVDTLCADCRRDADCVALGAPAGSACVPVGNGYCAGFGCPTGRACMPRCGYVPPAPTP